ncbi:tyrosine--tRNA ligase [Bacteroidia bacterium]|nr:tyrosine--tRNA ligase [Bacteroidia bacterium]
MMNIEDIYLEDINQLEGKLEVLNWDDKCTLWGVGPAAPLHLGYDSLIVLQKKILEKNPHRHFLLMADMHAILSHKFSWKDIRQRCYYYEYYFREICGLKNCDYVLGSYFQTRADYIEELYSSMGQTSLTSVKDTLPTSTKKNEMIPASVAIYPLMQCLDIFHLGANLIIAEKGQGKIYDLCKKFDQLKIARLGMETKLRATKGKITFLYIPTSHDIDGKPLNCSNLQTRISIHENQSSLSSKIDKMYAPPHNQQIVEGRVNAILEFYKYSVFPWFTDTIDIQDNDNNTISYRKYEDLETAFNEEKHTPQVLKTALKYYLWKRLSNIQQGLASGIDSWIDKKRLNDNAN